MRKHPLQLIYVALAWLVPLLPFVSLIALSYSAEYDYDVQEPMLTTAGMIIIPVMLMLFRVIYGGLAGLGIVNIIQSFKAYKRGEVEFCFDSMLVMKYGMIPFFILNYVSAVINHMIMLVAGHGITILIMPLTVLAAVFMTYLYLLTGAFWGLQTVRACKKNGLLSKRGAVFNGILQYIFVVDVASTVYLSVKVCKRGKKVSLAVLIACAVLDLAALALFCLLFV